MNAKQLAELLNGREIGKEITKEEEKQAWDAGLVVVFGASDDLMEFRGAIHDEIDAYNGGTAQLTDQGLVKNECESEDCPHFKKQLKNAAEIEAHWCIDDEASWKFETTIEHETFEIKEDGEVYCVGIVFKLSDVESV